ncbi:MAG: mechanosensitive ion channel family protein [Bacteroidetes bacterium]|nr:MAG: mechanosensitive ion channel family protein [Bacteroidota bacterium]
MSDGMGIFIENATIIVVTILLALLADFIVKRVIISSIAALTKRTKNDWDDVFVKQKVFNRLAHLAPALIVYYSLQYIFEAEKLVTFLGNLTQTYMILVVLMVIDSVLNAMHEIYMKLPISQGRNIKGYIQVVKIIFYTMGIILIISVYSGETPKALMAGVGAMAAVLMLVFKDTILGFVASIQLSANKMVNVGDWISMPKYNADGDVIDISLNTVKVQNWDKTIATIPTYALVSESFNNWKGMEDSGGRRIKRSINIDMNSVTFLDEAQIEKLGNFHLLKDYISNKQKEIAEYNKSLQLEEGTVTNGRKMTNLGTFRKYLEEYLQHHPMISNEMTFLVRHLQPTDKGLPVEIYVFSKDQAWANYEAIQADIFDHTLAILPEFDLHVFQSPSGGDFQKLVE